MPRRFGGDAAPGSSCSRTSATFAGVARVAERRSPRRAARSTARPARWCRGCSASPTRAASRPSTRRLDAAQLAYKASCFASASLPVRGRPASRRRARPCARRLRAHRARRSRARRSGSRTATSRARTCTCARARPAVASLIDLQGAWLAPPEYDLVCLLRDSYVELPEAEIAEQLARRRAPRSPTRPTPEEFARALRSADARAQGQGLRAASSTWPRARGDPPLRCASLPATLRHLRAARRARAARDAASRAARRADRAAAGDAVRAMIVAAGLGTRLRPLTDAAPEAGAAGARAPADRLPRSRCCAPRRARGGDQPPPPARAARGGGAPLVSAADRAALLARARAARHRRRHPRASPTSCARAIRA